MNASHLTEKLKATRGRVIGFLLVALCVSAVFAGITPAKKTNNPTMAASSSDLPEWLAEAEKKDETWMPGFVRVLVDRRDTVRRQLIDHLILVSSAMALAITVGVGTGVLLTRFPRFATPVLGAASVIQTIPSLALLALMIPLLGTNKPPAITALFLYAVLPILRNTYTAIEEVDPAIIEVGRGMGMTEWQILWKVEVPLCVPVVVAGVRTSTVICVGIATLCTFIGAGGLGGLIMDGMQQRGSELIIAGVLPAVALALVLDGTIAAVQRLLTPRGLKLAGSQ